LAKEKTAHQLKTSLDGNAAGEEKVWNLFFCEKAHMGHAAKSGALLGAAKKQRAGGGRSNSTLERKIKHSGR